MSDPAYILVSDISGNAARKNLFVKSLADLGPGDYILSCNVDDDAYVKDLTILPYDNIGASGAPEFAIGSTVSGDAYEKDLRVIDMPNTDAYLDYTPLSYYTGITIGSWDEEAYRYTSEQDPYSSADIQRIYIESANNQSKLREMLIHTGGVDTLQHGVYLQTGSGLTELLRVEEGVYHQIWEDENNFYTGTICSVEFNMAGTIPFHITYIGVKFF